MWKLDNKKGQGIQFNWIYVVVAGAIILGFFSWFIVRYIDLQNTKLDAKVARNIDSSLLAVKGASQFKPVIDLRESFSFNIDCDSLSVNSKYTQKVNDKIIFSNSNIANTRKLNVWTYGFEAGFFVDNFIYIIDPRQKYYLVYQDNRDFAQELYDRIPSSLYGQISIMSYDGINLVNAGKNKFILFFEPSSNQLESLIAKGQVISIDAKQSGQVTFYKTGLKETSLFFGDALAYGAIFSDNLASYDCSKKKALDKLGILSNIYYTKARSLAKLSSNPLCNYNSISNLLKGFSDSAKNDDVDKIYKSIDIFVLENRNLYDGACEGVF